MGQSAPLASLQTIQDNAELEGEAATPEECAAIWRNLDRQEKWAERRLMETNKEKGQVLHPTHLHQYSVGAGWLEGWLAEKDLGVLVAKKASSMLSHIRQCCEQVKEGYSSPLHSSGEATSGILCLFLSSSLQEAQRLVGVSPVKGHKTDKGLGASVVQGQTEEAGIV